MIKMAAVLIFLCFASMVTTSLSLDNGLARTPPMGWLSWQRFRCNTDCENYPKSCISERLYMDMADRMSGDGYKAAGYEYVNIDDCWSEKERDENMKLVPDRKRFPSGIAHLAKYVHSKGLKLGIYGDMGTKTCGGYPGSKFTLETDAQTFAAWGIDSFKMDGCYSTTSDFPTAYPIMEFYLNKTQRPILFSCSWPAYDSTTPDYPRIAKYCNIWRNYGDIADSWDSVKSIIKYYGDNKGNFSAVAGPGNFNDPDMVKAYVRMFANICSERCMTEPIIVGDEGLSPSQEQVQMAMWSMMAAPLFLSSDLRYIRPESAKLLLNKGVIALNQDKLGIMGKRVFVKGNIQAWTRPVTPAGSYAIALLNLDQGGYSTLVKTSLVELGILEKNNYQLTEIFSGNFIGTYNITQPLVRYVDVSSVFLGKLTKM